MKEIAIIGPTASGKSDLAIAVAQKMDGYILSIDSLSVYKEIDIASAKPSQEALTKVRHFGINELYVNEYFSVELFLRLYKNVVQTCKKERKNLIIVGGTSFYLKMLLDGLSTTPEITQEVHKEVSNILLDLPYAYSLLEKIDPSYAKTIAQNDRYRIEKALLIYKASNTPPTQWFAQHPPSPIINDIKIYEIAVQKDVLQKRIMTRTAQMLEEGLIDEVCFLERKYTRAYNPMKAIGIIETLDFLDGKITQQQLYELIVTHTLQLAKRQKTFNKSQFKDVISLPLEKLYKTLL
jgi:tRNA dimethylallyltransferase